MYHLPEPFFFTSPCQVKLKYTTTLSANAFFQMGTPWPGGLSKVAIPAVGNCMFSSIKKALTSKHGRGPTIAEQRECIAENWDEDTHNTHVSLATSFPGPDFGNP